MVNHILYEVFLLSVYLLLILMNTNTGETVHMTLRILNQFSFWLVNFMSVAKRPNFSECVRNPRKVLKNPDRLWSPTDLLLPGYMKLFIRV